MDKKDFCIIGVGRFGTTIANKLISENYSVMVIDSDRTKINKISGEVSFASTLDATNPETLKNIGINNLQHIIVAIGENVKDSIMTCAALAQLGLPNEETQVTAKASNERHANVLKKLGITDVVTPEKETGENTALRIIGKTIEQAVWLTKEIALFKISLKNNDYVGLTIEEVLTSKKIAKIHISAIQRQDKSFIPTLEDNLEYDDVLWVTSTKKEMKKIEQEFNNSKSEN